MNVVIYSLSTIYRSCQGFLRRPSYIQPIVYSFNVDFGYLSPLRYAVCSTRKSYDMIITTIATLLLSSRPSTVFLIVVTIYITPIYSRVLLTMHSYMGQVGLVHIFLKLLKSRPVTTYTPASIVFVLSAFSVVTSLLDMRPSVVKMTFSQSVGSITLYKFMCLNRSFVFLKTAAAFCMSATQCAARYLPFCTAVTINHPYNRLRAIFTYRTNCCKPTKFLSRNIFHKKIKAVRCSAQLLFSPAATSNKFYYTAW